MGEAIWEWEKTAKRQRIHNQIIQLSIIILFFCLLSPIHAVCAYAFLMTLMFMSCISVIFFLRSTVKNTLFFPFYTLKHPPEKGTLRYCVAWKNFPSVLCFFFFFFISPSDHNTKEKLHIKFNLFFRYGKESEREKAEASRSSLILLA